MKSPKKKTRHATYIGAPRSITLTDDLEAWLQAKVKGGKSFCAVVREQLYLQMENERMLEAIKRCPPG